MRAAVFVVVLAVLNIFVSAQPHFDPNPPDPICPAGWYYGGPQWQGLNLCGSPRATTYLLVAQCVHKADQNDVITRIAGSNDPNHDGCGPDPDRNNVEQNAINLNQPQNTYLMSQFCPSKSGPFNFVTRVASSFFFDTNPCYGDPNRGTGPAGGEQPHISAIYNGYNALHWSICQLPGVPYDRITRIQTDNDFTSKNVCENVRYELERGTIDISSMIYWACSASTCPSGVCQYKSQREWLACY